jgi:hypothetical protein
MTDYLAKSVDRVGARQQGMRRNRRTITLSVPEIPRAFASDLVHLCRENVIAKCGWKSEKVD